VDERLEREVNLLHANICQALADPKRILILYALSEGPMNVTELTEALDVPQPTVSRHLKVLRERHLVSTEREGTSVRYSLSDARVIEALDTMRAVLLGGLTQQARLAQGLS
jgi:DNA-binding transcriptional ArsR family regulator